MDNNDVLFGVAQLDSERKKSYSETVRLKEGNNVYRVLPPMMSLAKTGKYSFFWKIHFGFRGTDGRQKVIVCLEESRYQNNVRIITKECPICTMVNDLKAKHAFLKEQGKLSENQLKEFYDKKIKPFGADMKHYMNAVDDSGKIVTLAVPKTAKDEFEKRVDRLRKEEGIDAMGMNGVYLNFVRSGKGFRDTVYTVEPLLVPDATNPKAKVLKEHSLDAEFVARLRTEARDLSKIYTPISLEDVQAIVNSEDPGPVVDRVFARGTKENRVLAENQDSIPGTGGARGVANVKFDANDDVVVERPEAPRQQQSVAPAAQTTKAQAKTEQAPNQPSVAAGLNDAEFENFMKDFK